MPRRTGPPSVLAVGAVRAGRASCSHGRNLPSRATQRRMQAPSRHRASGSREIVTFTPTESMNEMAAPSSVVGPAPRRSWEPELTGTWRPGPLPAPSCPAAALPAAGCPSTPGPRQGGPPRCSDPLTVPGSEEQAREGGPPREGRRRYAALCVHAGARLAGCAMPHPPLQGTSSPSMRTRGKASSRESARRMKSSTPPWPYWMCSCAGAGGGAGGRATGTRVPGSVVCLTCWWPAGGTAPVSPGAPWEEEAGPAWSCRPASGLAVSGPRTRHGSATLQSQRKRGNELW